MRLVSIDSGVRILTVRTERDVTAPLERAARLRVQQFAAMALDGFVLKKDSPSCGLERVKVYSEQGLVERRGTGIFASTLQGAFPLLPVEDEGRLQDASLREHFVERVFAHRRLRTRLAGAVTPGALVTFHSEHKLELLAHSPKLYRHLGRLVASAGRRPVEAVAEYRDGFMKALAVPATPGRHANVLQHVAGYFDRRLDRGARRDLANAIDEYRQGIVPLVVPVALLAHHVHRFGLEYLQRQLYLQPHPRELKLRNHA
jgi:uncharacterized protein YbgA (DUF1722 family)